MESLGTKPISFANIPTLCMLSCWQSLPLTIENKRTCGSFLHLSDRVWLCDHEDVEFVYSDPKSGMSEKILARHGSGDHKMQVLGASGPCVHASWMEAKLRHQCPVLKTMVSSSDPVSTPSAGPTSQGFPLFPPTFLPHFSTFPGDHARC